MAGRGLFVRVRSIVLAHAFSHRVLSHALAPTPAQPDPDNPLIGRGFSLSPRRPGPVRRAVALLTAAVFALLPPLQTVSAADDGQRPAARQSAGQSGVERARRQLANVDPSLMRLPTKL